MPDTQQRLIGIFQHIAFDIGRRRFRHRPVSGRRWIGVMHERIASDLAPKGGDDLLRRGRADAGQTGQPFRVLPLNGVGDLTHRTHQGLESSCERPPYPLCREADQKEIQSPPASVVKPINRGTTLPCIGLPSK